MAKAKARSRTKVSKLEQLVRRKESAEGVAMMDWVGYHRHTYPEFEWLFHVPNGGLRDDGTASQLKREGLRAGVADYILLSARHGYFGLVLELKVRPNKPTDDQIDFLNWSQGRGYFAMWCYGWTRAVDYLAWYCSGNRTDQVVTRCVPPDWNSARSEVLGFAPVSAGEPVELHECRPEAHFVGRRSRRVRSF